MFGFIIDLLVIGLVAGFIARALVPGNDSMSVVQDSGILGAIVALLVHLAVDSGARRRSMGAVQLITPERARNRAGS